MTFKQAKEEANKINGVVLWWCTYYTIPANEYNEAMGLCQYISPGAKTYFRATREVYKKEKQENFNQFILENCIRLPNGMYQIKPEVLAKWKKEKELLDKAV